MAWDDTQTATDSITHTEWNAMVTYVKNPDEATSYAIDIASTPILTVEATGITVGGTITVGSYTLTIDETASLTDYTANADTDISGASWVIDENDMSSNLDTKVPTQQSVKAYADLMLPLSGGTLSGNLYVGTNEIGHSSGKGMTFDASGNATFDGALWVENTSTFGLDADSGVNSLWFATGDSYNVTTATHLHTIDIASGGRLSVDINGTPEYTFSDTTFDIKYNLLKNVSSIMGGNQLSIYPASYSESRSLRVYSGNSAADAWIERFAVNGHADIADIDITNAVLDLNGCDTKDIGVLNFNDATELTIATGAITITQSYHKIDTESDGATDDLATINGGTAGDLLILRAEHTDRTVVVKNGTGNIQCAKTGGDVTLDNTYKTFTAVFDGSNWLEM